MNYNSNNSSLFLQLRHYNLDRIRDAGRSLQCNIWVIPSPTFWTFRHKYCHDDKMP